MKHTRKTIILLIAGLLALAATPGCSSQSAEPNQPRQEQNESQAENQTEDQTQSGNSSNDNSGEVLADCFINFYLTAWEDLDADGVWDEGEPPLEGVGFIMRGNYAHSLTGGKAISDSDGEASIDAWAPGGCPKPFEFILSAETPEGYRLTTEAEIIHDAAEEWTGRYQFGFAPEE